jgi:predicted CoA-binding protein
MTERDKIVEIGVNGMVAAEAWSSFWSREDAAKLVRAALAALEQAGYAVVPVNPTEEMCRPAGKRSTMTSAQRTSGGT